VIFKQFVHRVLNGAVFTKKFELIFLMTRWFGIPPRLNRAPLASGPRKPAPHRPFVFLFSYPAAERNFSRLGDVQRRIKAKIILIDIIQCLVWRGDLIFCEIFAKINN
jgi:hypothetical protein